MMMAKQIRRFLGTSGFVLDLPLRGGIPVAGAAEDASYTFRRLRGRNLRDALQVDQIVLE